MKWDVTNLSLTNMEVLIAVVDDAVLWAACSNETQTLEQIIIYMSLYSFIFLCSESRVKCLNHCLLQSSISTFVLAASSTAFSVETPSLG